MRSRSSVLVAPDLLSFLLAAVVLQAALGALLAPPESRSSEPVAAGLRSEEVRVSSSGVRLAGVLEVPGAVAPVPGVLLLSGAGAHDRRGELGGNERLTSMARHLQSAGIATMRLDDRGVGQSEGVLSQATIQILADDAERALEVLARHPGVDATRVGILGGSEGALVAARAASSPASRAAFVVLVSLPNLPGRELFEEQQLWLARRQGADESTLTRLGALAAEAAELALAETLPQETRRTRAREVYEAMLELAPPRLALTDASTRSERMVDVLLSPLLRSQLEADGVADASRLRQPVLALQGALDTQVPAEHFPRVRDALADNPHPATSAVLLPGLNHLLQPAVTGLPDEYAEIDLAWHPDVPARVSRWVRSVGEAHE